MKDLVHFIIGLLTILCGIYIIGFIGYYLGIMVTIYLWNAGHYVLAILQVLLVINYLFGGKRQ